MKGLICLLNCKLTKNYLKFKIIFIIADVCIEFVTSFGGNCKSPNFLLSLQSILWAD